MTGTRSTVSHMGNAKQNKDCVRSAFKVHFAYLTKILALRTLTPRYFALQNTPLTAPESEKIFPVPATLVQKP